MCRAVAYLSELLCTRLADVCRALRMRDAQFSSKAYGTHDYKEITIDGRVQLDLLLALQRDHKLSSYSLNAVRRQWCPQNTDMTFERSRTCVVCARG